MIGQKRQNLCGTTGEAPGEEIRFFSSLLD